jgi:NUMOD1 domain./NUMOD4 motif.
MEEEWRRMVHKHTEFGNKYDVSNYGRVVIRDTGHIMSQTKNKATGYMEVSLTLNGFHNTTTVHRLVALAFVNNPHPGQWNTVNHCDENKINNLYKNLEWCSSKYNNNYGTIKQRESYSQIHNDNNRKVPIIVTKDDGFYKEYRSLRHASDDLYINRSTITARLQNPRAYTDQYLGYHFKYKDINRTTKSNVWDVNPDTHGINASNHKKTKEEVQSMIQKIRPNIIIVGKYIDTHTTCDMKCTICGHHWSTMTVNGILSSHYNCPQCSKKHSAEIRTVTRDEAQAKLDMLFKGNLKIMNNYVGLSKKCTLKCKTCKKEFEIVISQLLKQPVRNGCKKCNQRISARYRNLKRYRGEEEARRIMKAEGYEPTETRADRQKVSV